MGFFCGLGLLQVLLVSVITSAFSLFPRAHCTMRCWSECCDLLPYAIFSCIVIKARFAVPQTAHVLPQGCSALLCAAGLHQCFSFLSRENCCLCARGLGNIKPGMFDSFLQLTVSSLNTTLVLSINLSPITGR